MIIVSAADERFVPHFATLLHSEMHPLIYPRCRTAKPGVGSGTSNSMIVAPLFDLKFLAEFAAGDVGTSNRRH
jgi:hypothetical protein